jgi:hypothetical protein
MPPPSARGGSRSRGGGRPPPGPGWPGRASRYDPRKLHFHHVDFGATKLFGIADGWRYSPEKLAAELGKCVVLDYRCHRPRHAAHRAK